MNIYILQPKIRNVGTLPISSLSDWRIRHEVIQANRTHNSLSNS